MLCTLFTSLILFLFYFEVVVDEVGADNHALQSVFYHVTEAYTSAQTYTRTASCLW